MATKPKAAIDPESKRDNNEATWQILLNIMIKEAFLKALMPVTIITFAGICALAPLYVTMGIMTRQMEKVN